MFDKNDKHISLVALFGAIGGILFWAIRLWRGHSPNLGVWLDALLSLLLGAGASMVFVFLVSNTDRTDRARIIALALVAGLFWEPVLEASRALVDRETEQAQQKTAIEATRRAAELAESLPSLSDTEQEKILADIRLELQTAHLAARDIDSISRLRQVQAASEQLFEMRAILPQRELRTLLATLDPISDSRYGEIDEPRILVAAAAADFSREVAPRMISPFELPLQSEIEVLTGGITSFRRPSTKIAWFSLPVAVPVRATIEAAANADLVASIYDRNSLRLIETDDDSGGNRNPKLHLDLPMGDYLIRIRSYHGDELPPFDIQAAIEALPPGHIEDVNNGKFNQ
jgi:hypothetical protein